MARRKLVSPLKLLNKTSTSPNFLRYCTKSDESGYGKRAKWITRKAISAILISLTGGVALSAIDDLAIYQGCSSKAMEKATADKRIVEALGEPIEKGPWYNASLAVAHKRHTVSCTFPISGPQGNGVLQLKAVHNGDDDTWFSFLRPRQWDILIMDALLHVPANEDQHQTLRINLSNNITPLPITDSKDCRLQEAGNQDKK